MGLVGALVFVAWTLLLALRTLPCVAWVGASLLAMLALALQTDMIGVPWVMYVLFALAGGSLHGLDSLGGGGEKTLRHVFSECVVGARRLIDAGQLPAPIRAAHWMPNSACNIASRAPWSAARC